MLAVCDRKFLAAALLLMVVASAAIVFYVWLLGLEAVPKEVDLRGESGVGTLERGIPIDVYDARLIFGSEVLGRPSVTLTGYVRTPGGVGVGNVTLIIHWRKKNIWTGAEWWEKHKVTSQLRGFFFDCCSVLPLAEVVRYVVVEAVSAPQGYDCGTLYEVIYVSR